MCIISSGSPLQWKWVLLCLTHEQSSRFHLIDMVYTTAITVFLQSPSLKSFTNHHITEAETGYPRLSSELGGVSAYMEIRPKGRTIHHTDFSSSLPFPQWALPMGKRYCWYYASAICALWGFKHQPTIPPYVHWTMAALSWELADRTLGSVAISGAEIVMIQYPRSWFVTQPLSLPSPWILIFSVCDSCCQGRERRGANSIYQHGHCYRLCPGMSVSCPAASHRLSCDIRAVGSQLTSLWIGNRPCWEDLRVLEMKAAFCFNTVSSLAALLLKRARQKGPTMSCCVQILCGWNTLFTLTQKTVIKGYKS